RRDLAAYAAWLAEHGVDETDAVTPELDGEFAAERASADPPPAASSLARLQSSVRGLHRFLAREGTADADPTTKLVRPKQPQKLPQALTIEQVEALLDAPSSEEPRGLRGRALLELLYAT